MLQGVVWPCVFISCLPASSKWDLAEVEKAMIQGIACPLNYFCLPADPKCHFGGIEKAKFQGLGWPCKNIFCLSAQNAMFQRVDGSCENILYRLAGPKCDFNEVEESMFQGVIWP
jgi:hypothetical protein